MATSRVKTNLFLTFEIAAKWQNVCYTQRSYGLISLNQPKNTCHITLSQCAAKIKSIVDWELLTCPRNDMKIRMIWNTVTTRITHHLKPEIKFISLNSQFCI